MTIVYLIRHSKTIKVNNNFNSDSLQIQNEKASLSLEGEQIAEEKLNRSEFDNIDVLFSSNYVRAIQTAKYIATKNNIDINVVSDLGERRFGISSWNELSEDFEKKQLLDENYKIGDGESQKEVRNRMYSILMKILDDNKDKKIVIISHATAISYLLKNWCDIKFVNDKLKYNFNGKTLLDGYFDYCEIFKLEFENKDLVNITNISF